LVDLGAVAHGMEDLLRRSLGESIRIASLRPAGLWETLADKTQVESALLNLAVNARDAMPAGGTLTIETANVEVKTNHGKSPSMVPPGDYVLLSVADTGTGMSAEVQRRAFDPFFTTKAAGKGSGLGLSMVYGFVKQSGGYIHIESKMGLGTKIRIYLPRHEGPIPASPDLGLGAATLPRGSERILVVEDDPLVRRTVVDQLKSLGYAVVQAGDGREAFAALSDTTAVQLLFTDIVLPGGLNGAELAEKILRERPGIKVVFTTGYTEDTHLMESSTGRNALLLRKPYPKGELARVIRQALDT